MATPTPEVKVEVTNNVNVAVDLTQTLIMLSSRAEELQRELKQALSGLDFSNPIPEPYALADYFSDSIERVDKARVLRIRLEEVRLLVFEVTKLVRDSALAGRL